MNANLQNWLRGSLLSVAVLGAGSAVAGDHGWKHGRWDGYDQGRYQDRYQSRYQSRYQDSDYDYARVIDVDPIVRRVAVVTPQQECWREERQVYGRPRSATPAILGAIIGGVVGHQFGHGSSRNVATAAGAVLGASVGHDSAMQDAPMQVRDVERCEVTHQREWAEQVEGYKVRYVYRGREYCTNMAYDPGNRVRVRVGYDVDVVR